MLVDYIGVKSQFRAAVGGILRLGMSGASMPPNVRFVVANTKYISNEAREARSLLFFPCWFSKEKIASSCNGSCERVG